MNKRRQEVSMEYLKKEIRTFQNGKTVNDQFYIDDDYNVPDAKKAVSYTHLTLPTTERV